MKHFYIIHVVFSRVPFIVRKFSDRDLLVLDYASKEGETGLEIRTSHLGSSFLPHIIVFWL
jgi:hypothetical protein